METRKKKEEGRESTKDEAITYNKPQEVDFGCRLRSKGRSSVIYYWTDFDSFFKASVRSAEWTVSGKLF